MALWEERLGRLLAGLRLDSIRNKILVLALMATLMPALSTATLSYVRTRRALTQTLEGELRGIGSQSARELDIWVQERQYDLRVFVGSFEVTENLDRIERGGTAQSDALARLTNYLTSVQGRSRDYTELTVLNESAEVVASSAADPAGIELPEEWPAALREGRTLLGTPYWDESFGAVATLMAVPISSANGRFLGALRAIVTFETVGQILTRLSPGESGRIDLLTGNGRVVVASAPIEGFELALARTVLESFESAPGGTREYLDGEGELVVGTLSKVDRMDWSVLVHLPSAEAFEPIRRLRNTTVALLSFLLVVVGTVAYFIGLLIVRPLARLAEGAAAVAEGDLSVDLPVTGKDEVGYLTEVFNGMVAQLRAGRDKLDEANSVLRDQNAELERISMTDGLTSLFNRRYLMKEFDKEIIRARRHDRPLSVLMMDVDKFKQFNDNYGHQAGDEVLMGMGRVVREATREPDVPARYGGEEFIALLPDCDINGAVEAAERIRSRLAKEVIQGRTVTISIGAATYPGHGDSPTELIAAADEALYAAKNAGRDRVVAAGEAGAKPKTAAKKEAPAKKKGPAKKKAPAKKKTSAKKKAGPKKPSGGKKGGSEAEDGNP